MIFKTYLGLGADLGSPQKQIHQALKLLKEKGEVIQLSFFYQNPSLYLEKKSIFLNLVCLFKTSLSPRKLLIFTQQIQKKIGRRPSSHHKSRKIDIDIIFYEKIFFRSTYLKIPHPHYKERDFVLHPLALIAPNFYPPQSSLNIKEIAARIPQRGHFLS